MKLHHERILCPICKKNVSLSFRGTIARHNSAIKQLNGKVCSASGRILQVLIYEVASFQTERDLENS